MRSSKLKFSASMIRTTIIYSLSGFLMILWLLQSMGLRGVNCFSAIYEKPLNCIGNANSELFLWGATFLLIVWELLTKSQLRDYIRKSKLVWLPILFLLLALVSTFWSIAPMVTLERSIILIFATFSAVFIAQQKNIKQWVNLLAVFFGIIIIFSYLLVFLVPSLGKMEFAPYYGAWCGIFWHRNYLGGFIALASVVFLFKILFDESKDKLVIGLSILGFLASIGLVFGSRSGAGILTLVLLIALTLLLFIWTRVKSHLKTWHYLVFGIASLALIILVFTNLDFVFGLVHRNTSLTGRLPLWDHLYKDYISNRLILGHGYGAIWTFEQFRVGLQTYLSWGYPVLIGDNGLIDIVLHLGIIGVIIIVSVILYAFFITCRFALREKKGMAFFPLICIIFVVMSNISLSMLVELEFFVWALLIIAIIKSSDTATPKIDRAKIEIQP